MAITTQPPPTKTPEGISRWRKAPMLAILSVLFLLSLVAFNALQPRKTEAAKFTTATVQWGDIHQSVSATGKVVPNFEVEIKGKASGKILRLPYDVGDIVQEGALLVQLDPIDEMREVNQAQATLAGTQSRLSQTRLNVTVAQRNLSTDLAKAAANLRAVEAKRREMEAKKQRLQELVSKRYISQEEYETGVTTAVQSESDLENAKIRLRELQTQQVALQAQAQDVAITGAEARANRVLLATTQQRLSETRIYAPISGVVTSRTGQIGQIVSSGISNVGGGTTIMTLADLSRIFVLAAVDESDIGQVREGSTVEITVDAYPNRHFQGKVLRIAPKGLEASNVVTFEVKIEILDPKKHLLKPEMTANVSIILAQKNNVLTVPVDALVERNHQPAVRVLKADNTVELRPVGIGLTDGAQTEIRSGLAAGEIIVASRGEAKSRWRKDPGAGSQKDARHGQMMMMRNFGHR